MCKYRFTTKKMAGQKFGQLKKKETGQNYPVSLLLYGKKN